MKIKLLNFAKKVFFLLILICSAISLSAQTDIEFVSEQNEIKEGEEIFVAVEEMPEFPGGQDSLWKYLSDSIRYSLMSQEHVEGKVVVSFIVEIDGSLSNIKILQGVAKSLDEESLRVVKAMPKWIPGKQRGKSVRVMHNLAIPFYFR